VYFFWELSYRHLKKSTSKTGKADFEARLAFCLIVTIIPKQVEQSMEQSRARSRAEQDAYCSENLTFLIM
jgi:hypothetical protein